jgi:hypothetical protein
MRSIALRVCAGLFALSWIVFPGFGAIDLSVTWNEDWPQVLEAGWGLFSTVIVAVPFVLVTLRPRATPSAVAQLAVAALALVVSAVVAEEAGLLWFAAGLILQTGVVALLHRGTPAERPTVSRPILLLGVVGAVPWLVYALRMWAANRENRPGSDLTIGVDHYSMQGALALSLALLPLLAGLHPRLRPLGPACAGVAALYLAVVSLGWPDAAAALGKTWSLAAAAWAVAVLAAASRAATRDFTHRG